MAPQLLTGTQIRQKFLDYFANLPGHAHTIRPSASLIPDNPTVLLTPAGMLPFVPIFLGIEPPPTPPRAVSSQKCARVSGKASDLENVGRTPHHHTFFEMLGNFSFGDYFKAEVIPWAWDFVTKELGVPTEHLWVSVLGHNNVPTDEESYRIWRDVVGVPEDRILCCGEKDNFWGPPGPTGPCGPCTEIHFDRAPEGPSPKSDISLLDDAQRFTEIWNLVFMEKFQDEAGNRSELARKNIDTGMGLERIAMVLAWLHDKNVTSTFDTDLFQSIIQNAAALAGVTYGDKSDGDIALKVIADHARFAVFAVNDGVVPSNEGRGYILRMIIRRAYRYAHRAFPGAGALRIRPLVSDVCKIYGEAYPELTKNEGKIQAIIDGEEQQFAKTLHRGSELMDDILGFLKAQKQTVIPGSKAFELYDTYGFPIELTKDIAAEHGLTVDEPGFEAAMAEQKERSRGARKATAIVGNQIYGDILSAVGTTPFLGYETLAAEATVVALIQNGERVDEVGGTNQPFEVVLDKTPFYPEGGGQVGDRGTFTREDGHHGLTVVINDTQKVGELIVHHALFDNGGQLRVGERLIAQVEPEYRQRAAIHHTATHLLNSALRKVLGESATGGEIAQAGSQVTPESARFDFTFPRALTPTEINRVEFFINEWIRENTARSIENLSIDEAKASGAISMAGETYGESVRVIGYGGRSKELCGGTHVHALGEIGLVKILSEGSIASGVRRIELVAGERAYKAFKQSETTVLKAATLLKTPPAELLQRLEKLQADVKALEKQLEAAEVQRLKGLADQLASQITKQGDTAVLVQAFEGESGDALKTLAELLIDRFPSHHLILGSNDNGKAQLVVAMSPDQVAAGHKAGQLIKTLAQQCGGGGGGKPAFAQAGGKQGEAVKAALAAYSQSLKLSPANA